MSWGGGGDIWSPFVIRNLTFAMKSGGKHLNVLIDIFMLLVWCPLEITPEETMPPDPMPSSHCQEQDVNLSQLILFPEFCL